MATAHFRFWEPEETVGSLWHGLVEGAARETGFGEAAVGLDAMRGRMGVLLRGLGDGRAVAIRPATAERTRHRRGFFARIGHAGETGVAPCFDGETLDAPSRIEEFADRRDNADAYLWLAAWAAFDDRPAVAQSDALKADLGRLRAIAAMTARILAAAPGLRAIHDRLAARLLAARKAPGLPPDESAIEEIVRQLLGSKAALSARAEEFGRAIGEGGGDFRQFRAGRGHLPFRPVLLWPERRAMRPSAARGVAKDEPASGGAAAEGKRKKATRIGNDRAGRRDSLVLNRFETIQSWAEALDLNRKVEDDDADRARKAASDQEEIGLSDVGEKATTRLAFDLDLAPQDVEHERLAAGRLLPEWDFRRGVYLADQVRILEIAAADRRQPTPDADPESRRRIAAVRRRFEALKPRRTIRTGEEDGDEVDADAAVRLLCDLAAGHGGSPRVFRRLAGRARDLSVATLLDASRSTESVVGERQVISVARESLAALGHGLQAAGDSHAVYSFSSLRRDRVFVTRLKDFEEPMSDAVAARFAAIRPGHYTRLGAAVRFVAGELRKRGSLRRLLLILTDGKPNDLDYYEGRYGVEDTRKAVAEARMAGLATFAVTIDRKADSYIPHIFGVNGYAIVNHPARLAEALPLIYRQLLC